MNAVPSRQMPERTDRPERTPHVVAIGRIVAGRWERVATTLPLQTVRHAR